MRLDPVVDPALIRALDVGQAAYIYRGGVTYAQVKRLVAPPAALRAGQPPPAPPSGQQPPPHPRRQPALPDIGPLLDDAFGAEPSS